MEGTAAAAGANGMMIRRRARHVTYGGGGEEGAVEMIAAMVWAVMLSEIQGHDAAGRMV